MKSKTTPEISVSRLKELFIYNTRLGSIINAKTKRKLLPNPETGLVNVFDGQNRLRKNLLYRNLAYILGSGNYIPNGKKVLSMNLNDEDIMFHNLKLVDQKVYRKIKIALKNLAGELQIKQHSVDKHSYFLTWLEPSRTRRLTFHDIGNAEQRKQEITLELVKFVNLHICSN